MDVLLCKINGDSEASDRLRKNIEEVVPTGGFRIARSIRDLHKELGRPTRDYRIVVLIAANVQELDVYLTLKDLLKDVSIILILPNVEKQTLIKGSKLYPRFTSDIEGDFKDIAAVVAQMLRHMHFKCQYLKERR
jgi:hypothetical protein